MKHRTLFIVLGIVLLIYGLLWLVLPVFGLSLFDTVSTGEDDIGIITRYWGSAYVGLAVLLWLARKADTDSIAVKAIMISGFVTCVTGLAVTVLDSMSGPNPLIGLTLALYALFSIWLGYFVFKKQS